MTSPARFGNTLIIDDGRFFMCAEYNANTTVVELRPCRATYRNQVFFTRDANVRVGSVASSICVGPRQINGFLTIAQINCTVNSPAQIEGLKYAPFVIYPDLITTLRLASNTSRCIDGTFTNLVRVSDCVSGNAFQRWYHQWGQIRNVGNGLCLDAVDASGADPQRARTTPIQVQLRPCDNMPTPTTQMFYTIDSGVANGGGYFVNGETMNCVYETRGLLQLGTDFCGPNSVFGSRPSFFINAERFIQQPNTKSCDGVLHVRKEFRDLSKEEKDRYFSVLDVMYKVPSLMGHKNRLEDFQALHSIGRQGESFSDDIYDFLLKFLNGF
jgi:hypothetical protein